MLYLLFDLHVLLQHDEYVPITGHVVPGSQKKFSQSCHEGVKLLLNVEARAPSPMLFLLARGQ